MASRQRGWFVTNSDGTYSIGYRLPNGRRKQEGTFPTKRAAQQRLNAVLAEIGSGAWQEDVTFDVLADRWLAVYDRAKATRARARFQANLARAEFGRRPVRKITPEEVARWRMTLPERSRHQTHAMLRQILEAGVQWGYAARNVAKAVSNPQPPRAEARYFDEWTEVLLIAAELGPYGGIPILGAGTGLRPEEWCALDWRTVDLDGRALVVVRKFTEDDGLQEYGKTSGSRRRVPLRQIVVDYLAEHRKPRGLVFPSAAGGPIRIRNWRRREWYPALDAAGIEKRKPYALRHTYASWSLAAGVGVFTLARRMGTSVEMIDRTYGHLLRNADDVEAKMLDEWDSVSCPSVGRNDAGGGKCL